MNHKPVRIAKNDRSYPATLASRLGETAPVALECVGDLGLLRGPSLGLLVSRRCPGPLVLETFDAVRRLRPEGWSILGGFHSPMERQCLESLLLREVRVVMVLPRRCAGIRLQRGWRVPLERGRLLLLSPFPDGNRRSDRGHAHARNVVVAALSEALFVPFAAWGGSVERCSVLALGWGIPLLTVGANAHPLLRDRAMEVERWIAGSAPARREGVFALT